MRAVLDEAVIVDLDFSRWYSRVSIHVIAQGMRPVRSEFPLFVVHFLRVDAFRLLIHPRDPSIDENPVPHPWWNNRGVIIKSIDGQYEVTLNDDKGFPSIMPRCIVKCGDLAVEPARYADIEAVDSGWPEPTRGLHGLARPDIKTLAQMLRARRRSR